MSGSLAKLRAAFTAHFATWELRLPDEALPTRRGGVIRQAGWTIYYVFGLENGYEYLDFYASHRMTNDQIWRISETGDSQLLAAGQEFYVSGDPESERQSRENNQHFDKAAQTIVAQVANGV